MNVEELAREAASEWVNSNDCPLSPDASGMNALVSRIEAAILAAMRPPKGHIIDETGAVRRVLGTLPVTADGCVVGDAATIWHYMPTAATAFWNECTGESSGYYASTYSSEAAARAAAEAARGAEG